MGKHVMGTRGTAWHFRDRQTAEHEALREGKEAARLRVALCKVLGRGLRWYHVGYYRACWLDGRDAPCGPLAMIVYEKPGQGSAPTMYTEEELRAWRPRLRNGQGADECAVHELLGDLLAELDAPAGLWAAAPGAPESAAWKRCPEGPWQTREEAEAFRAAEVGAPGARVVRALEPAGEWWIEYPA